MDSTELGNLWDRVFGTQPAPEQWLVVVTGTLALIAVVPNPLWRLTRNAITIAHEGGHGLIALLTGRRAVRHPAALGHQRPDRQPRQTDRHRHDPHRGHAATPPRRCWAWAARGCWSTAGSRCCCGWPPPCSR